MAHLDPALYADLEFRGLLKQVTSPDLKKKLASESMTLYCGFDPTADSLHVGSLLPLLTLRRFQRAGHKVYGLVGGATGMIGDPSFKSQERKLLGPDQLALNLAGITKVVRQFLDMQGANAATVVNNYDWFKGFSFIEFLRDVGKHFTVNHMMGKESVRARLEDRDHGISYTEFSYMLLQAYDFHHLYSQHGCTLQIGGSDQWGNITAGTDLIRRMKAQEAGHHNADEAPEHAYGITFPLVTKSDGTKFGKSESGTIWLSAEKTSPYEFYQFFIQTTDADVGTYLRFFTFLSHDEILALEDTVKTAPEKREAQLRLAREMTLLVHGEEGLQKAQAATGALFSTEIKNLNRETLMAALGNAPNSQVARADLDGDGLSLIDALVAAELCPSKGQARKDLQAGGIYVNNERVADANARLTPKDLIDSHGIVLRKGKKTYHLLAFEAGAKSLKTPS